MKIIEDEREKMLRR